MSRVILIGVYYSLSGWVRDRCTIMIVSWSIPPLCALIRGEITPSETHFFSAIDRDHTETL